MIFTIRSFIIPCILYHYSYNTGVRESMRQLDLAVDTLNTCMSVAKRNFLYIKSEVTQGNRFYYIIYRQI